MGLENLISAKLTKEEKDTIFECLDTIENVLKDKVTNLTPEQRKSYARIGDETENWINKVRTWMDQAPETVPFYLNLEEFDRDRELRETLKPIQNRFTRLVETMGDTFILLGTDVYNLALAYYRNIKVISRVNEAWKNDTINR